MQLYLGCGIGEMLGFFFILLFPPKIFSLILYKKKKKDEIDVVNFFISKMIFLE